MPDPKGIQNRLLRLRSIVDEGHAFQREDVDWLERNKEYVLLGRYYENMFKQNEFISNGLRASKYWRLARRPDLALAVTDCMRHWRSRGIATEEQFAIILTTRAAAYKDLGNYTKAKQLALWAAEHSPDNNGPLTLLSMIYWATGNTKAANDYLDKSKALGLPIPIYESMSRKYSSAAHKSPKRNPADLYENIGSYDEELASLQGHYGDSLPTVTPWKDDFLTTAEELAAFHERLLERGSISEQ